MGTALPRTRILSIGFCLAFLGRGEISAIASERANNNDNIAPLQSVPYNLDGADISIAAFDAGFADATHPDLVGRVFNDASLLRDPSKSKVAAHATHMAGIMLSSGVGNAAAKGAAPKAKLYSYFPAYVTQGDYADIFALVRDQSKQFGWRVAHHPYGDGFPCNPQGSPTCKADLRWSSYIDDSQMADRVAYELGVLSVYSAGNDGLMKQDGDVNSPGFFNITAQNLYTIYSGATGKNAIAVCAATEYRGTFYVKEDSSFGPARDGRVKPDLCAEGTDGWTTDLNGGYTTTQSTSPASAVVVGAVALLQEQNKKLNGVAWNLPPEFAKGLLIHTARDMASGTLGEVSNLPVPVKQGPDAITGWGFVDTKAAVDTLRDKSLYASSTISVLSSKRYDITVPAGQSAKITLIWNDPPGPIGTGVELINDLDLKVSNIASPSEVYYPWVLDPADPLGPATTGMNHLDNVEQVVFTNRGAAALTYRIAVTASSILGASGTQSFYVLSTLPLAEYAPKFRVDVPAAVDTTICTPLTARVVNVNGAGVTLSERHAISALTTPGFAIYGGSACSSRDSLALQAGSSSLEFSVKAILPPPLNPSSFTLTDSLGTIASTKVSLIFKQPALQIVLPASIVLNQCFLVPVGVLFQNYASNLPTDVAVDLQLAPQGLGTVGIFSDSACTQSISSTVLPKGSVSTVIYMLATRKPGTTGGVTLNVTDRRGLFLPGKGQTRFTQSLAP